MDTADLREGIYDCLVANVPAVGGRVYWGYTARADTVKPFLEFSFLSDVPSVRTPLGMFHRIEVIVVGEESNILDLDPIADLVVSVLHDQVILTPDGRYIRLEYRRGSKYDFYYEPLRANAIRIEFWLPTDFWI
jgi:hypothetical protein